MSFIDNNIIPILSGENLNMIVLDYKEEQYKKIISNSKRHRKYYIEKIEEITNEKIINLMENIINNLSELIMDVENKLLLIDDIRHEINYKTNGMNQEILRINKKFTDDIYELNKKYDYWLNNKNFVLYSISTIIIFLNIALCLLLIIILFQLYQVKI